MLNKLGRITRIGQNRGDVDVDVDAPPGQFVTKKFPVLTFGPTPRIPTADWQFRVFGLVAEELTLDWEQFNDLPQVTLDAEFHCVTQWSKLQNTWQGILFTDLMKIITPNPEARYVMAHCYGGYTANVRPRRASGRRRAVCPLPRRKAAEPRARWTDAPGGAQAIRLEERQVGQRPRVHGARRSRLLGDARLPHGGRPMEGRALLEHLLSHRPSGNRA